MTTWYQTETETAARTLETDLEKGLSADAAAARLKTYGYNELKGKEAVSFWSMLLNQFKDFLVLILIAASAISILLGETTDSIVIIAIVIVNAVLGVIQESRAEKALEALKRMAAPNSKVIRNEQIITVPSRELAPGDIVLLETGDYIPADIRIVEAVNLKVDESSLTGESVPVDKTTQTIAGEVPLGDRINTGFMSTIVTYGRGKGLVVDTGMNTEIGKIAQMIEQFDSEETPLQKKLEVFGRALGFACLAICGIVFLLGVFRGEPIFAMFMTAVSLAVAAIPEGLPAVVTIVLALGMQRMIKRHSIIKKLHAVETLGSTTVICSDKTGTLTQNQMTAVKIFTNDQVYDITGEGYTPTGTYKADAEIVNPLEMPDLALLLTGISLCNDAQLQQSDSKAWKIAGDPTEGALVVASAKAGLTKHDLSKRYPRVQEIPFDSGRKMMTTFHKDADGSIIAFVKGAPDLLLQRCSLICRNGQEQILDQAALDCVLANNHKMAEKALRVLAVACRRFAELPANLQAGEIERNLTFIGLIGMIDPPRSEAKAAVAICRQAGIRPIMITGDYKDTAMAVAQELGIASPGSPAVTGAELDAMSQAQLRQTVCSTNVFARVSPQNKMDIVDALQQCNQVAAMTGDGVNDAPALKKADIGVSMGITGTDVAKETADMVLTDDNFASIVAAVEEGRVIFSNIRKSIFFLLSCNLAEILVIFLTMLFGWPVPLLPIQLLWLNLVTDAFPALALGMEQKEPDTMQLPPRDPKEPLMNKNMQIMIVIQSTVLTLAVIGVFYYALTAFQGDLLLARTYAFTALITGELLRAYTTRSERYFIYKIGIFSNKFMNWGVGVSFLMLLASLYIPPLQVIFKTFAPGWEDWTIIMGFAILPFLSGELGKLVTGTNTMRQNEEKVNV